MAETTNYEVTEVHIEGLMGPKGDKGEPFTYDDFTEAQLAPFEELKTKAETAAASALESKTLAQNAAASAEALKPDVVTVANNMAYVSAVSVMSKQLSKVGENIESVVAVDGGLDNIATVRTELETVKTVATNIDDVKTVADNIEDVNKVADISDQVKVVGSNKDAVEVMYKTLNMYAEATTLAPGSQATVTQTTTSTGFKVTFGIPQGLQGEVNPNSLLFTAQTLTDAQKTQVATNLSGNWLPLSGGEVTGALTVDGGITLKNAIKFDTSKTWYDCGYGWDNREGAGFCMRAANYPYDGQSGAFVFFARNSSDTTQLIGLPSGSLSWGGNAVLLQTDKTSPSSSSNTWKLKLSSGMLIQGGYISADDLANPVTFATAFSYVPTVTLSYVDEANEATGWLKAVSTTGFTPATSSTTATGLVWQAIGWV